MKKSIYFLVFLCSITFVNNIFAQRRYIDLTGCETTINPSNKYGWGILGEPNFEDNFTNPIKDWASPSLTGPGTPWTDDYYKIIWSDEKWSWRWGTYSRVPDPCYDRLNNILINPSQVVDDGLNDPLNKFIRLQVNNEPLGINNGDAFRYPVTKYYSSSYLLTVRQVNGDGAEIKPEDHFTYGWFEVRCKLPVAKYSWPAFWLFSGLGGNSGYNEIDCIELGSNDYIVHTNHWIDPADGNVHSWGEGTFAMPGQTFGGHWVTYAVKWEPNKIIWYINNKPVRIVKDNDYKDGSQVRISNHDMCVLADNYLNMEWLRYNALENTDYPNNMDIDYIRVWQRSTDPTITANTPDPVFSINGVSCGGTGSGTEKLFISSPPNGLVLNASESYMPGHHYTIIIKQGSTQVYSVTLDDGGTYSNGSPVDISHVSLNQLYGLLPNVSYEVIVRGSSGSITVEQSQKIKIVGSLGTLPTFKINGVLNTSTPSWPPIVFSENKGKSALILDVSEASLKYGCDMIRIEFWDGITGGSSYPYIDVPITGSIMDLEAILKANNFYYDTYDITGGYYLASTPYWSSPKLLFGINSCTTSFVTTLNTFKTGVLKNLQAGGSTADYEAQAGDDVILSASGSTLCNNLYTVTIKNVAGNSLCNESLEYIVLNDPIYYGTYSTWYPQNSTNAEDYSIGNFDIRKFCRQKGVKLEPGQTYFAEIESGGVSQQESFVINDISVPYQYPSDFLLYRYYIYCPGSESNNVFASDDNIYMYSPDPTSLSVDRSYTLIVEDLIGNTPVNTIELTGKQIYQLKIMGSLDLKTVLPINSGQFIPGMYRITLRNYSSITVSLFSNPADSRYFSETSKIIKIYPKDREINLGTVEIDANKTINSGEKFIFSSSLKVKQGKTLTVKGELQFNKDCKLIIEHGAKLIVDGGILTSNKYNYSIFDPCLHPNGPEVMWNGIEVWGTTTASQYPILYNPNQGKVELKNGAIIENALVGIKTIATDANGNNIAGTTGGIINASSNTTFRNNQVAVQFYPYQNYYNSYPRNNLSSFTKCIFETTQILNQPAVIPDAFVKLQGVNGINFLANTFRNTVPQNFIVTVRGIGIYSTDAGYTINALCNSNTIPCSSFLPNIFEGLFYGIYAQNISSLYQITTNRSNFLNNNRGIYLSGVYNPTVTLNTFDVGATEIVSGIQTKDYSVPFGQICAGYGLYLANVNTINVQENQFLSTHNGAYGSLVWSSGVTPNELYKNYYHDLKVGTQTSSNNSGLQIKCNSFNPNINLADIGITSGSIANQGSCGSATSPAGNIFNTPCNSGFYDIMANTGVSPFNYYYYSSNPLTIPNCYTPVIVNPLPCSDSYTNLSCPSKLNTGNSQMQLLANINTYNSQLGVLTAKIDGGSTQNLLNKVQSGLNSGQLKNVLVAASPYLTDTVLIATLNRSQPLTPGHLKEVLVPNSPLTTKVFNVFNTKILPPGIKQQIVAAQTGTSARAILEQQISGLELQRSLAVSELMQIYMSDTTGAGIDNIIAFLKIQPDLNSKKLLVQAYLVKEQCSNAKTLLTQLPNQNTEDFNFYTLNNLLTDLCIAGKTVYDLTATQKQTVENIAFSNTMASSNAQAILTMVYSKWFPEIIEELTVPENQTLRGYLYNNVSCNNLPVPNDTIILLDTTLSEVKIITPVVTDITGKFKFNYNELMLLDENALYTFGTKSGAILQDTIFKTIRQWLTASPVNLNLKKLKAGFINDTVQCFNDSVYFTNKTMYGKKPYTYNWTFALHSVSTLANPIYKYPAEGTYNVTLIATDALGCKDTVQKQIVIPACSSIFGTINESVDCGSTPVINDTIFVTDEFGNDYDTIFAITNNSGQFAFNSSVIAQLDTNYNYAFKLKSGYGIAQLQFNSINYWKSNSPHSFIADHKEYWTRDFNMSDSAICSNSLLDLARNIYIAGIAYYPNLKHDYMLVKYNPLGNELWHISYNPTGFGNYNLSDMKVDSSGNCILTGYGSEGTVTVKINSSGAVAWSNTWIDNEYFGKSGYLTIDTLNNVFVATGVLDASEQIYLALTKYSSNGQKLWSTVYNTISMSVQSIKKDKSGNVVVLCLGQSTGGSYILKYNPSGTLLWSIYNTNYLYDIAVGNDNSVYVTGETPDLNSMFFTAKYDASGNYQWNQFYSYSLASGDNVARKVVIDKDGNIIVAGVSPFETTSGPPNNPWKVYRNCYSLIKYAPDGTELWNTILSIRDLFSGPYYIASMVTDKIGNIYTAGSKQTTPYISGGSGSLGKPYYQFLTTKINTNGDVDWIESPYTTKENSSNLSDLIISDNENIYVTGTTMLNGIRTIKYVQCPSDANLKSLAGNSGSNNSNQDQNVFTNLNSNEYLNLYPNPNDGRMYIDYSLSVQENYAFAIFDLIGKKVFSTVIKSGRNTLSLNGNVLSNGTYSYKVFSESRIVKSDKLLIIK